MEDLKIGNKFSSDQSVSKDIPTGKGIFDIRLPLFGYTTETVTMLLTPMFKNK